MNRSFRIKVSILPIIGITFFNSCIKTPPVVTTADVSTITQTSAVSGGNVTNNGGADVISRGVCWSTTTNPTIISDTTINGKGNGSFISSLTNLNSNTVYYVRAYGTNSEGTGYGNAVAFTTHPLLKATVTTSPVTSITSNSAESGGNITDDGGAEVTARGVCWNTIPNPSPSNFSTSNGSGTGSFTSSITGLQPGKLYYYRAYATNIVGTSYGEELNFTMPTKPTITTNSITEISEKSAKCGGYVTDDGGAPVTARGICWSTSPDPDISNSHTTEGNGAGSFTSNLTDLLPGYRYYVRAYAENIAGIAYAGQKEFTTPLIDSDGNVYNYVTIDSQVWTKENLKTTKLNDGTAIPNVTDNASWASLASPAYCWYDNNITNKNVYGALYNWHTVKTGKLCPSGWHVPTDAEWKTLEIYLGMTQAQADATGWRGTTEGGKLKEAGTDHWSSPNVGATNESSFTALPGGYRNYSGAFKNVRSLGYWWSATEGGATNAWARDLGDGNSSVLRGYGFEVDGFSVRCLRDK